MRFDILTIFPNMFESVIGESIIKRAQEKNIIEIYIHDIRSFTTDKHHMVDDYPFGGGAGMVLKVDPVHAALQHVLSMAVEKPHVCLMCPRGKVFDQPLAKELSTKEHIVIIAGHYEGYDERIRAFCDQEISLGDFILTGGEIPALAVLDAVTRLLPGSLGDDMSSVEESFSEQLLEYPHYTRPREFLGQEVPEILLSGHHAQIKRWRRKQALLITSKLRPDLLLKHQVSKEDKKILAEIDSEYEV